MEIFENFSLRPYNTFGIDVLAKYFARFQSVDQLQALHPYFKTGASLVLGGGSNILFTKNFEGIVAKNEIRGIQKLKEDDNYIYINVGAGETWHELVTHCVSKNWGGIENLSLIPGSVGAAPIQNIGAYGVELKDVFYELKAWHIKEQTNYTFGLKDCKFGYRESIFKNKYLSQFIILSVALRLTKLQHNYQIKYGAIEAELEKMGQSELSLRAISDAVISIRQSKLPNPAVVGNAGSFFKNPVVEVEKYNLLKSEFENIVAYPNEDGKMKLAAGWLIEQCGWKGFVQGNAGVHDKQALVLVNRGDARGHEILELSNKVIDSVKNKFDIILTNEVNIV